MFSTLLLSLRRIIRNTVNPISPGFYFSGHRLARGDASPALSLDLERLIYLFIFIPELCGHKNPDTFIRGPKMNT